jgi:hypothetical protein
VMRWRFMPTKLYTYDGKSAAGIAGPPTLVGAPEQHP